MLKITKVSVGNWFYTTRGATNNDTRTQTQTQHTLAGHPTTELRPEVCRLRRAHTKPVLT